MADSDYADTPMGMLDLIDDETYASCRCVPVTVRQIAERPHLAACTTCGALYRLLDESFA